MSVVVPARAERLEEVHGSLDRFWQAVDRVRPDGLSEDWKLRFATAVMEIAANIVEHAYAGTEGDMRLELDAFTGRAVARFHDRGAPYARGGPDPGGVMPEGGYGLPMAEAALDSLEYARSRDGSNRWLLVKRFPGGPSRIASPAAPS